MFIIYFRYFTEKKITVYSKLTNKFDLEKQWRRARVLCNLSIELLNLCRDCQKMDDEDKNCITMETLEETITNYDLDDLILNAIKSIRNNKKRPDCSSIYDNLSKSLSNSDISKELISSKLNYLTKKIIILETNK